MEPIIQIIADEIIYNNHRIKDGDVNMLVMTGELIKRRRKQSHWGGGPHALVVFLYM